MIDKTSMDAQFLHRVDGAFVLTKTERPKPGPGHVLVRVKASSVNPLDVKIRKGKAPHAQHSLPAVLGMDIAGIVEEVGAGVARFVPGDEVFGLTGGVGGLQGSLASFAAVDEKLLAHKPAVLSMREAASLPLSFITAWEGLVDRAHVQSGQKVLIQGVGGVGHTAIQIARAFGAEVFATDRAEKKTIIEGLGAVAIDHQLTTVGEYVEDYTDGQGFDLVYDTVGGPVLDASFKAVKRFGHVVSCLGWGTHSLAPLSFRAATYSGVFTLLPLLTGDGRTHHGEILSEASRFADAGFIVPQVDPRRFNLVSVAEAYDALESGSAAGKIVVEVEI